MTHDPLCWTYIKGLPDLTNPCDTCAKIAMIRADERERIENERSPIWSEAMDAD